MEKRIALVTGSVQGIGKGIALRLAKDGYSVVILARSEGRMEEGRKVAEECEKLSGSRCICVCGDISASENCKRIAGEIAEQLGSVDVLVNCAGVTDYGPIEKFSEKRYRQIIANNMDTAYFMTQAVIPAMKKKRFGRIISISSIAAPAGSKGMSAYAASKAGIEAFSRSAANELAPYGITVNCILPGYVNTSWLSALNEEYRQKELETIPAGRFGEVEDIAALAAFLASDEASYILGQSICITGGMRG